MISLRGLLCSFSLAWSLPLDIPAVESELSSVLLTVFAVADGSATSIGTESARAERER